MRRVLILLVLLTTTVLSAAPAGSAPVGPRTVEFPYTGIGTIEARGATIHSSCLSINDSNYGGACLASDPKERRMEIEVADESGQDIGFTVYHGNYEGTFCSATDRRISIVSGKQVYILLGTNGCATPSLPVSGVIRVTLSR